jgi:hypothetical protein
MSYFLLPKINNNNIIIHPMDDNNPIMSSYNSHSVLKYYNETTENIKMICHDISLDAYSNIVKIVNPYEYIFSKVPGSTSSVSKLKNKSNLFYDFIELSASLNIFESYKFETIKALHLSCNNKDTIECFEMIRDNCEDEICKYNEINDENIKLIGNKKYHFIFVEAKPCTNLNEYVISLIDILILILKNQMCNGTCIIKINYIFHKPVVDMLYILSSLFSKTYIIKPSSSNIATFDKYIVCKNYQNNNANTIKLNYYKLVIFLKKLENKHVVSLLDFEMPYYFTCKIDDINIIYGQQQLESLDLMENILKNKNKEDKIEIIKKSNIQKAVAWCEKYNIPCNKFSEKTNIFLPIQKGENILADL